MRRRGKGLLRLTVGLMAAGWICGMAGCSSAPGSGTEENGKPGEETQASGESNGGGTQTEDMDSENQEGRGDAQKEDETMDYAALFQGMKMADSYKGLTDNNPIINQHFGADPYAMVYGDTVYFYMTADAYEYDAKGEIKENTYGTIKSLYVVSTKDMVNFTDHGEIKIGGPDGAAKWAHNSWAPAAAWKEVDGKPKFFLYFADNGGGIGVVTSDSPVGPFVDELGHGLIRRDMENCGNVLWLFDPAVLVDDDGKAYIYFGGGVPEGKASHPMTGRCCELGEDMMSLVGVPTVIDAPYLFEDSGIHKYGDTYYYTYCSNFNVGEEGKKEYGFESGEIICMESKSPLGPFTVKERILKNPGAYWGLGGNNHHCVFEFKDQWYITYHTRLLEKEMKVEKGYRSTHIESFEMGEDGTIGLIPQTKNMRKQVGSLDAYEKISGATFALMAGVNPVPGDETAEKYGCGNMILGDINSGDFVKLQGVEFGEQGASKVKATVRTNGKSGVIRVTAKFLNGDVLAYLPVEPDGQEETVCTATLDQTVTGLNDIYFTFHGEGYEVVDWQFE